MLYTIGGVRYKLFGERINTFLKINRIKSNLLKISFNNTVL